MRNIIKGILLFGVVAPPVGSLVVTWGISVALVVSGNYAQAFYTSLGGIVPFAFFSYIFGGIPALATGAVAGWFRDSLSSKARCVAVGILGGLLSIAYVMVMSWPPIPHPGGSSNIRSSLWNLGLGMIFVGAPGVIGGTVTAIWFRPLGDGQAKA